MEMKKIFNVKIWLLFVFVLAAAFYYWNNREIKGSPDDYSVNNRIIENKRAGLKVFAPEGWDIEIIDLLEGSVAIDSPDIEGEKRNGIVSPPLDQGCGIEGAVIYKNKSIEDLKGEIDRIHFGLGMLSEEFEEIKINNNKALKNTFDSQVLGPGMAVYFAGNKKVYSFCVYWGPEDKQRCVKHFEDMLNNTEIAL